MAIIGGGSWGLALAAAAARTGTTLLHSRRALNGSLPKGVTQAVTCTFAAVDNSSGVRYAIAWGDGATACAPSCATYATPGTNLTANHTYSAGGPFNASVNATDNDAIPQTSSPLTSAVLIDATPPTSTLTLAGTRDALSGRLFLHPAIERSPAPPVAGRHFGIS